MHSNTSQHNCTKKIRTSQKNPAKTIGKTRGFFFFLQLDNHYDYQKIIPFMTKMVNYFSKKKQTFHPLASQLRSCVQAPTLVDLFGV